MGLCGVAAATLFNPWFGVGGASARRGLRAAFGQGWRRCSVRNFCIGQSLKRQMAEIWGLEHDPDMGGRSTMSLHPELFGFCWWIYNYASPTGFQKSLTNIL